MDGTKSPDINIMNNRRSRRQKNDTHVTADESKLRDIVNNSKRDQDYRLTKSPHLRVTKKEASEVKRESIMIKSHVAFGRTISKRGLSQNRLSLGGQNSLT